MEVALGLRSDGVGQEDECLEMTLAPCSDGGGREDECLEMMLTPCSDGTRRPDELLEMVLALPSDGSDSIMTCCSEGFSMKLVGYSALTSSCNAFAIVGTSSEPESESLKVLSLA